MITPELVLSDKARRTSIVSLNMVSVLSQIGQFGLGAALLPIALEARHTSPAIIGLTSAAYWLGMLLGLLLAGQLTHRFGYRNTVIAGLTISAISFVITPQLNWHWWAIPASFVGFGLGLRWIGNETWLYKLAPANARGRIVGLHETLICLASIIGPLIIVAVGAEKPIAFWVAAVFSLLAIFPVHIATEVAANDHLTTQKIDAQPLWWLIGLGAIVAGTGGWMEGSLLALLPVYGTDVGLSIADAAWLLTILGVGAFACQYPVGWCSDHKGFIWTVKHCAILGFVALVLAMAFGGYFPMLVLCTFFLGGVTSGFLTLGMIWATQHSQGAELTHNVRQVSVVYTLLSAVGPFATGLLVSITTSRSLFVLQLMMLLMLMLLIAHPPKKTN